MSVVELRASDVIGRFGGEEFGMIRGGGPEGAAVLASKLRNLLGERGPRCMTARRVH